MRDYEKAIQKVKKNLEAEKMNLTDRISKINARLEALEKYVSIVGTGCCDIPVESSPIPVVKRGRGRPRKLQVAG